ncbi:MAG: alpha/beta hydrolase family protein [Pseudomonadota bacterium]
MRNRLVRPTTYLLPALILIGCVDQGSSSDTPSSTVSGDTAEGAPEEVMPDNPGDGEAKPPSPGLTPTTPEALDTRCDQASPSSSDWLECEAANYARTNEAPTEQLTPAFQQRYTEQSLTNLDSWLSRALGDLSWLGLPALNTPLTPLCATNALPCTGDPFRYPESGGPDGRAFFENEAMVEDVVFYDQSCARIQGTIWAPRDARPESPRPAIVITNGSVQAPGTAYRWAAQALVRSGYVVMTYDPRGQGESDQQTPTLEQGSNLEPRVFWEGQVNAIDFFRSTPAKRYPHERACQGTYPTETQAFNPLWEIVDDERLGIAGHSLGAIGVSVVQGYGAPGAEDWPGLMDESNPVDVAVAWDSLITPEGEGLAPFSNMPLPEPLYDALIAVSTQDALPDFAPRVPSMSIFADYGFAPTPYTSPPDKKANKAAFEVWQAHDIPTYSVGFQGTTHFDFSQLPVFPATSWCPTPSSGSCEGGWGQPSIEYYTLAWFDRWLKQPGEPGFNDADARLIDDAWQGGAHRMSFHYDSARDFPDKRGKTQRCEAIRNGCSRSDPSAR